MFLLHVVDDIENRRTVVILNRISIPLHCLSLPFLSTLFSPTTLENFFNLRHFLESDVVDHSLNFMS